MDARILVFGGSLTARKSLCADLKRWKFLANSGGSLRSGPTTTHAFEPDVILLDRRRETTPLQADLPPFLKRWPAVAVLALEPEPLAAEELATPPAARITCLHTPCEPWSIPFTLKRLLQRHGSQRSRSRRAPGQFLGDKPPPDTDHFPTRNPAFRALLQTLQLLAHTPRALYFHGEDGLEFEALARFLHHRSPQRYGPFLCAECPPGAAPLPDAPAADHDSADPARLLPLARGGICFLPHLHRWPLERQAQLAHAIQEASPHLADVQDAMLPARLVVSASLTLPDLIAQHGIDPSLLAALDPIPLAVPPLRDRVEDLIPLLQNAVDRLGRHSAPPVTTIDTAAMRCLAQYVWPGNLTELESVIRAAVVRAAGPVITADLLPDPIRHASAAHGSDALLNLDQPYPNAQAVLVRHLERQYLQAQLKRQRGNVAATARASRISRRAVTLKVREYALRDHSTAAMSITS